MWRKLWYGNMARPKALSTKWLAFQNPLTTKDKLYKFGIIDQEECCFCREKETVQQSLFKCAKLKQIWIKVLNQLQIQHNPLNWDAELKWIMRAAKGRVLLWSCSNVRWPKLFAKCGVIKTAIVLETRGTTTMLTLTL